MPDVVLLAQVRQPTLEVIKLLLDLPLGLGMGGGCEDQPDLQSR